MFGSVEHVMLMQDKETGRHRGFGFVTFEEGNIADLVVHIKYHTLHDRVMEVSCCDVAVEMCKSYFLQKAALADWKKLSSDDR